MAALAAIIGTAIVFTGAYLIEKGQGVPAAAPFAHLLAMLPMAVPGLVLGLGYVFFVNAAWNPLNIFYGTLVLLAVNSIAHFYTIAHITAVTALKQIDHEFEVGVGVAEGAGLAHLRARHRADLHAGDPRHRRLHVRQCADDGVGRDLPLRRRHQARLHRDRAHGRGRRDGGGGRDGDADRPDGARPRSCCIWSLDRLVFMRGCRPGASGNR